MARYLIGMTGASGAIHAVDFLRRCPAPVLLLPRPASNGAPVKRREPEPAHAGASGRGAAAERGRTAAPARGHRNSGIAEP